MKALLRSFVVLALVLVTTGTATLAYFTSQVSATGNLITTGTLRLAIDSTLFGGGNSGYVVAYDNGTTTTPGLPFPEITGMQPGDTRSVYVTVRNIGNLPFDYRANFSGAWDDTSLNSNVISVSNVRRFPTGNCFGNVECQDIYYWLTGIPPFTHTGVDTAFGALGGMAGSGTSFFGHANGVISDTVNTLLPNQFAIFQVDLTMSTGAGNAYQGQTFRYSMNAQAKQTNATNF